MTNVNTPFAIPGQIWTIGELEMPAIIVCMTRDRQFGFDLRAIPVLSAGAIRHSTELDVRIDAADVAGVIGAVELIACAWLAEPIASLDLRNLIGHVTEAALRRVRDVELVSLGAVESEVHREYRGVTLFNDVAADPQQHVARIQRAWRENLAFTAMVAAGVAHVDHVHDRKNRYEYCASQRGVFVGDAAVSEAFAALLGSTQEHAHDFSLAA